MADGLILVAYNFMTSKSKKEEQKNGPIYTCHHCQNEVQDKGTDCNDHLNLPQEPQFVARSITVKINPDSGTQRFSTTSSASRESEQSSEV